MELYKESLIHKIEDDLAGRNKNWEALENHIKNISDEYDPAKTYQIGDYAIYENTLYRCISVTNGEWDSSAWVATSVAAEIVAHKAEDVTQGGVHGLEIEEGAWTPVLIGTNVAGTHTYSTQIGQYYKIGKYVCVTCNLALSSFDANASGGARIAGLPFVSNVLVIGALAYGNINYPSGRDTFLIQIAPGESFASILMCGNNIPIAGMNITNLSSNSMLRFTIGYTIA